MDPDYLEHQEHLADQRHLAGLEDQLFLVFLLDLRYQRDQERQTLLLRRLDLYRLYHLSDLEDRLDPSSLWHPLRLMARERPVGQYLPLDLLDLLDLLRLWNLAILLDLRLLCHPLDLLGRLDLQDPLGQEDPVDLGFLVGQAHLLRL